MHIGRVTLTALAASLGLAVVLTQPTSAAGDQPVINEVYARGGSANQPYATKFVELYNPSAAALDLSGYDLNYAPASSAGPGKKSCALAGTVPAKGYFLIAVGSNGDVGAPISADQTCGGINPSGTRGSYALLRGGSAVDVVGWGSAKRFETAPAAYPGTNASPGAIARTGGADTDDNSADFSFTAEPTPQNAGSAPPPVVPPTPGDTPIAEIQGDGDQTPMDGREVTTLGVVTAAYPTGGFGGFYLQAPGTGGTPKAPGEASDGIFVHAPDAVSGLSVGACVRVSGTAGEYHGLTQLGGKVTVAPASGCSPVKPTELPTLPASDAQKEPYEGMLVRPLGNYTVTNNYRLNQYGQVGLAVGDKPLFQATAVVNPGAEANAYEQQNLARYITLDDGASLDYLRNPAAQASPLPYLSQDTPMRTGARVRFTAPVILDFRYQWNFQPTGQVVGADSPAIPVTSTNDREAAPPRVGGDLRVAAFNVLNYFTDLGEDEPGCQAYRDRDGKPVTANRCVVRGAYTTAAFNDQQAKIVAAINALDADVVSLMEVENSAGIPHAAHHRDAALAALVDALNAAAGTQRWAFAPSPAVSAPNEDVIRTAFIFNPATVKLSGASQLLLDPAFANARYPLAQRFVPLPGGEPFVVVANHFKSKGSGADDGTGQGLSNPSREAQARALASWTAEVFADEAVLLSGDFNAYTRETPLQILEQAGFVNLVTKHEPASASYQFSGRVGSLDHIFANPKALALATGGGVWDINGDESVAMEYSRRNYNVTDFYAPSFYRSSDHDPVLVGLRVHAPTPTPSPTPPQPSPTVVPSPTASATPPSPGPSHRPLPRTGAAGHTGVLGLAGVAIAGLAWRRR
ncbi:MAG: ExeM/NucH family extracellular endonuclease [Propionibacteriaceae bacterium]|nr:ExeM/NucH family extracellular endonuclease [Propionibacteriaceae bacterium]